MGRLGRCRIYDNRQNVEISRTHVKLPIDRSFCEITFAYYPIEVEWDGKFRIAKYKRICKYNSSGKG